MSKPIIDKEKLEELFKAKAEKLRNLPKDIKIDTNQKLKFYGLFKVVTVGPYNEANKQTGGFFDFEIKYKNEAWQKCSIFSKEEAMIQYVTLYNEIIGEKDTESFYLNNKAEKDNDDSNDTNLKVSIKDIELDIPDNFDSSSLYSSNVKQIQQEMTEFLTKATDSEKHFQILKEDIYAGDSMTIDLLKQFEKEKQINLLSFRDSLGQSILHIAVDAMSISAVEALIKMDYANELVNIGDNIKMTPMHIAAINFDMNIYQMLLELNPDISLKDNEGKTTKEYLKENEDVDIPDSLFNSN